MRTATRITRGRRRCAGMLQNRLDRVTGELWALCLKAILSRARRSWSRARSSCMDRALPMAALDGTRRRMHSSSWPEQFDPRGDNPTIDGCAIVATIGWLWFWSFGAGLLQVGHGSSREASGLSDDKVGLDVVLAFVCGIFRMLCVGAQGFYGRTGQFKTRHLNGG